MTFMQQLGTFDFDVVFLVGAFDASGFPHSGCMSPPDRTEGGRSAWVGTFGGCLTKGNIPGFLFQPVLTSLIGC